MRYSWDVWDEEVLAGRTCAKRCVFPQFCGFAGAERQFLKTGGRGGSAAQDVAKICTTPASERAIRKSKSLKTESLGAVFEIEIRKIWTALRRESDSEVKTVKNWEPRGGFRNRDPQNLHPAVARERFGSQNRENNWKHQGLGPLFEVQNAFRVAGTRVIHIQARKRIVSVWSACHFSGKSRRKASVSQSVGQSIRQL